ncbi:hypothetical protein RF11_07741 [Thelohanellus kitauei]|uniref:Uncharacterized protein n=1 Tax=Thelohanellus kitauei TaxID=669202 RepID=A0A0C2MT76_THEKT|nr:hypothetical protein RF11_07741 [Thelohanellus kitauei]
MIIQDGFNYEDIFEKELGYDSWGNLILGSISGCFNRIGIGTGFRILESSVMINCKMCILGVHECELWRITSTLSYQEQLRSLDYRGSINTMPSMVLIFTNFGFIDFYDYAISSYLKIIDIKAIAH